MSEFMRWPKFSSIAVAFAGALGCSSEPSATGGAAGSSAIGSGATGGTFGGSTDTGAAGTTGGSSTASGGATGIAGSDGAPNTGGANATAGSSGATMGGASSTAGAGGSSAGASGSTSMPPKPSPGCGKGGRPSGGQAQVANTSLYVFPTSYDGTKPFPLLIALHACGNPNTEFVGLTNNTDFSTNYVRSFPNTPDSGQCWSNYNGDVARILAQYDELLNNYCIDENRVFASAHSSGAQMLVDILSHKSDAQHLNLKAVSPVAADPFNVAVPIPVLYIDGKMDNQRSATSATNAVAKFRAANTCADTSKPYSAVMACNSTDSGHPLVDPGCISYDNCAVPTIWCSHNDPSYSGTEHGVPCFAMKAMTDFFGSLP